MFTINLKSSIATAAVIAGVLAAAGPASASSAPLENTMVSGVVRETQYVPERGPRAATSAALQDGTSNTIMVGLTADHTGSPLKGDSNEVAVEGVTAKTPSPTAEVHPYVGVVGTSAGFKSLSGMDSETEFMDYTDDSLLD